MFKRIYRTGQIAVALFLLYFTHNILLGGSAGNGFIDETGYYVMEHGNYSSVSSFSFYLNLYLGRIALGSIALVFLLYLYYKANRFYFRTGSNTEISLKRNTIEAALAFPAYMKILLSCNGGVKERCKHICQLNKISSYELIDSALAFYILCLFLLIITIFLLRGVRYIYSFYQVSL